MSDTPESSDTGWFTDGSQLETGTPEAAPEPVDHPANTVDAPAEATKEDPATLLESAGMVVDLPKPGPETEPVHAARAQNVREIGAALAGDAPAKAAFDRLVASGRIDVELDLLPRLADLARAPRAPALVLGGVEAPGVLHQVVRHLDDPLRVRQGRGRGTCGAATMEYLLLRAEPAELVRLVDGLTGIEEKVATRSGTSLALPPSAIPRDDTGRVDVDRLLQSALMNHATAMSWLFDYDNRQDHDDYWSAIKGNSRVPLDGFRNLYKSLRGAPYTAVSASAGEGEDLLGQIDAVTAGGERVAVLVAFTAPNALHWLAVEKIADGPEDKRWVYLRNPWGEDDGSGPPPRWPLPEGGGRVGMVYGDFAAILHGAVLPGDR
jgi:hypothetical protein